MQDYYEKISKSEKVHEQRELVVAIGKVKMIQCVGKRKRSFTEVCRRFQERNPNLAIYNMVLHDDEANPHLHIN
ncbi:plasmid recombination protein [Bacillus cereus]